MSRVVSSGAGRVRASVFGTNGTLAWNESACGQNARPSATRRGLFPTRKGVPNFLDQPSALHPTASVSFTTPSNWQHPRLIAHPGEKNYNLVRELLSLAWLLT